MPAPSLVPSFGAGFAVVAPDGVERKWDSQGHAQRRSALYYDAMARGLRFLSGVVVDYDCGGEPGPLVVVEPDWLRLRLEAGKLVLDVTNERPEGAVALIAKPSPAGRADRRRGWAVPSALGRGGASGHASLRRTLARSLVRPRVALARLS